VADPGFARGGGLWKARPITEVWSGAPSRRAPDRGSGSKDAGAESFFLSIFIQNRVHNLNI